MNLITLFEFRKLTAISDAALIELLQNNSISCAVDPKAGLLIDTDSVTNRDLIAAIALRKRDLLADEHEVLVEKASRIIRENLDQILNEVLAK